MRFDRSFPLLRAPLDEIEETGGRQGVWGL